jgi:hypothetical protein
VPSVALIARSIQVVGKKLESEPVLAANTGTRVMVAVLSMCILTLANYFPWRAVDKYHHYRGMRPDVRCLAEKYNFGKSLVLVRGDSYPDYQSAWVYNPLDPNARAPIYAFDRNPDVRRRVVEAYSDRPLWILNGPSITHGAFKVIKGPLSAAEVKSIRYNEIRPKVKRVAR